MNGTVNGPTNGNRPLKRFLVIWDYSPTHSDELELNRGDIILVSEEFDDGWMRGLRLGDLEIGFFPGNYVAKDESPIYKLQDIKLSTDHYKNDPKFATECDSSKRSKIALEMFTSEETYLSKLKMLDENFVVPLSCNHVIGHEDYSPVFSNIQSLLSLSENLLVQMKSRMEAWDERYTKMGDVFVHTGHHLKLFVSYAHQHTFGNQILSKISAQERFKNWLVSTETELQRTLNSLLLEPIQRVPRYELLLKDLLNHTSEDHPDYHTLRQALNLVQKIANECNETVRRADNDLKLFAITRQFPNDEVDIVPAKRLLKPKESTRRREKSGGTIIRKNRTKERPNSAANNLDNESMSSRSFFESEHQRVFVKEGVIQKTKPDFSDPAERYLFLCSDVLLIAQPTSKSKKTFKLKEKVMLVHAGITDTSLMSNVRMPDTGFILCTPNRMYHFEASTVEEKNVWFQELHSRISVQKNLFKKLLSHLSIPDEGYLCVKARAQVNYIGMLDDELSFANGDEILVMGFRDNSGRWRPGLYAQEPFDPSSEWYFGILKEKFGWFPMQCVLGLDGKSLEPTAEELQPAMMCIVMQIKQRMMELTGREVPPLQEDERTAKIFLGEGNFKTLRIPLQCTIGDVVRKFFKVKPDSNLMWALIEQSVDETVYRPLDPSEDPSLVVDFWGKSRDQMRFLLKQSLINF